MTQEPEEQRKAGTSAWPRASAQEAETAAPPCPGPIGPGTVLAETGIAGGLLFSVSTLKQTSLGVGDPQMGNDR